MIPARTALNAPSIAFPTIRLTTSSRLNWPRISRQTHERERFVRFLVMESSPTAEKDQLHGFAPKESTVGPWDHDPIRILIVKHGRKIGREPLTALEPAPCLPANRMHDEIGNFECRIVCGLGHEIAFDRDQCAVLLKVEIRERSFDV